MKTWPLFAAIAAAALIAMPLSFGLLMFVAWLVQEKVRYGLGLYVVGIITGGLAVNLWRSRHSESKK